MDVNRDFRDLLRCLNDESTRFIIVGAYAVISHTVPRYTKDLDVWVDPSAANSTRVWCALAAFGAPLDGVTPADFRRPNVIYQMGLPPNRIDVLTSIAGVRFEGAWRRRVRAKYGDQSVAYLGVDDLVRNKKKVGRPHDLRDVRWLERKKKGVRRT